MVASFRGPKGGGEAYHSRWFLVCVSRAVCIDELVAGALGFATFVGHDRWVDPCGRSLRKRIRDVTDYY